MTSTEAIAPTIIIPAQATSSPRTQVCSLLWIWLWETWIDFVYVGQCKRRTAKVESRCRRGTGCPSPSTPCPVVLRRWILPLCIGFRGQTCIFCGRLNSPSAYTSCINIDIASIWIRNRYLTNVSHNFSMSIVAISNTDFRTSTIYPYIVYFQISKYILPRFLLSHSSLLSPLFNTHAVSKSIFLLSGWTVFVTLTTSPTESVPSTAQRE